MHACRRFLEDFSGQSGEGGEFDLPRLERTTQHFARRLCGGVPGLRVHTFGSMLQYHYAGRHGQDAAAAAAAGGGVAVEDSRAALEDALWAEGVFAAEQCFLFLNTVLAREDEQQRLAELARAWVRAVQRCTT